jgi:hypothetical protein
MIQNRRFKKMLNTRFKSSLVAISVATILSACGGSSGGGAPAAPTNVTSSGTITQFGSVFVNGVRYETEGSRIVSADDGALIFENPNDDQLKAALGLGEVIKVRGTLTDDSNGTATTITVDDELVGAVTSIDDPSLTFKVMGQTISVSSTTIIDDSLLTDSAVDAALGSRLLSAVLTVGSTVEISGHPGANGIEATRIESSDANPTAGEAELKGIVSNLSGNTFTINSLTVDFSGVTITLADGNFVEVKGSFDGTDTLTASSVELEDGEFEEGEVEVEGVVQSITAGQGTSGTIKVNGFEFTVADISLFQVGTKIEIKAQLQNGSLQVIRIKDETEDNIRIRDQAISNTGSVISTRLGLDVTISDRSRLELDDDGMVTGDIVSGTYIEARGFKLNGNIVWTRIEASNNDAKAECRLRGPVGSAPSDPGFTIEGVSITTDGTTQFRDANDVPITANAFFTQVVEGDIVQAKSASNGTACGTGLNPAKEVSFEPEDDVLEGTDDNGNGGDDGADNELKGAVSAISAGASGTFTIAGEAISFDATTLIDDSLIEDFRNDNIELTNDVALGSLNVDETLGDLLATDGTVYVVTVDRSGSTPLATLIEDFD